MVTMKVKRSRSLWLSMGQNTTLCRDFTQTSVIYWFFLLEAQRVIKACKSLVSPRPQVFCNIYVHILIRPITFASGLTCHAPLPRADFVTLIIVSLERLNNRRQRYDRGEVCSVHYEPEGERMWKLVMFKCLQRKAKLTWPLAVEAEGFLV